MTVRWAAASEIMANWRPGSYGTHAEFRDTHPEALPCARCRSGVAVPWTWRDEAADLESRNELTPIVFSVRLVGILEPVLLGDDGRVWGGHHRILAANLVGELVPYEVAG